MTLINIAPSLQFRYEGELAKAVHDGSQIVIVLVTDPGNSNCVDVLFQYNCIQDLCKQFGNYLVVLHVVYGSPNHMQLLDIYKVHVVPLIIVIDKATGKPTGFIKFDEERETYCALVLYKAIRATELGSRRLRRNPRVSDTRETYDKGVNSVAEVYDASMVIDKYRCTENVYKDRYCCTRDVAIQFSMCPASMVTPEKSVCESRVWAIERTSPLPFEAVCRLQILLPNHGPAHAAASEWAIMADVYNFVSRLLDIPSQLLEISRRYPPHIFSENELTSSVCDLGLAPSTVLIVKVRNELIHQQWTLTSVVRNVLMTLSKPFVAVLWGLWTRVQGLIYSSSDEEEAETEDSEDPRPRPKKHQSNVHTLWDDLENNSSDDDDDDDDDVDSDDNDGRRVPNYNGNSTQLL